MQYPYENLENFTLPSLLDRSFEKFGKNDSFGKVGEKAMSYEEFNVQVHNTIRLLKHHGINKGDKVLLLSENMPNWGVAYFAVTYFGGVVVPVLPDFHTADVHRIIEHSEVKAAFVSTKHENAIKEYEGSYIKFSINLDSLEVDLDLSDDDYLFETEPENERVTLEKVHEDDLASLIYTSGTTGNSKGVMLSHKNLVTNAMSAYVQLSIYEDDVFLSVLPLAHAFECTTGLLIPVLHGSSVYYIDKIPTPSVLLKSFAIVRPTMILMVPLIMEKIYKNKILPKFTSSALMRFLYSIGFIRKQLNKIAGEKLIETFGGRIRMCGIGGAGISQFVEQFLIEAEFPFVMGYGLTETSPLLAGSILGEKTRFKSTGVPMGGVEIKIKDPDENGRGEIIVRSPSVMIGYYKDKEKTDEVIIDGWFHTGDLGYIDEDGYLYINGRSKNMLLGPGGENIYPEQIEAVINQDELVLDSLMMMNKKNQLIAKVHLNYEKIDINDKEKIQSTLEDMRQKVNKQVSSFSRMVKFVEQEEEFIKTPTKKIKRFLYTED